jgi:hypothetical protein
MIEEKLKVGQQINNLTVLDNTAIRKKRRSIEKNKRYYTYLIKCQCVCGKITYPRKHDLLIKRSVSCGCIPSRLSPINVIQASSILRIIKKFRSTAAKNSRDWSLTDEEASILLNSPCFYCNRLGVNTIRFDSNSTLKSYKYNGIDRIDNNKGYHTLNVVSCCGDCNFAKHTKSFTNFLTLVKNVYENLKLQNLEQNLIVQ